MPILQYVDIGSRLLVDSRECAFDSIVPAGWRHPPNHAVFPIGSRMERQTPWRPRNSIPRQDVWARVENHIRLISTELGGSERFQRRQRVQQPLRVVVRNPCVGRYPLRFEPNQNLDSLGVGILADRFETVWKAAFVNLPSSNLWPTVLLHVPSRIHPPVVDLQFRFQVTVDMHDLVGFVAPDHLPIGSAAAGKHHRFGKLSPWFWHSVCHHPTPPLVLSADPIAMPIE